MSSTLTMESCVVRGTNRRQGPQARRSSPATSAARQLHYGRVTLDAGGAPLRFETGGRETGLVSLRGRAEVRTGGRCSRSRPTTRSTSRATPRSRCARAPRAATSPRSRRRSTRALPAAVRRLGGRAEGPRPALQGRRAADRAHLNILIGKNVEAGRILAGVTFIAPGNWTLWPPHEHAQMLEEVYVYFDMPAPAFGIQLVYTDPDAPELA